MRASVLVRAVFLALVAVFTLGGVTGLFAQQAEEGVIVTEGQLEPGDLLPVAGSLPLSPPYPFVVSEYNGKSTQNGLKSFWDRIQVDVNGVDEDAESAGLTYTGLRAELERHLRTHLGWKVYDGSWECRTGTTFPRPTLTFRVTTFAPESNEDIFVYSTDCEFERGMFTPEVKLFDMSPLPAWVTAWAGETWVGTIPRSDFADYMRVLAHECADGFAAAFLEANPDFEPYWPSD